MNKLRILTILAASAGFAAASQASYELLMAVDFGAQTVRRFDGVTGAQLGSFGKGYLRTATSIAINSSINEAYVLDRSGGNRIYAFNYNTGEYLRDFSVGGYTYGNVSLASNGDLLMGSTNNSGSSALQRFSKTGSLISTYLTYGGQNSNNFVTASDGAMYAVDYNGSYLLRYATPGASYTTFLGNSNFAGYRGQMVSSGSLGYSLNFYTPQITPLTLSSTLAVGTTVTLAAYFSFLDGATFGHGNILYIAGSNSTGYPTILRYNTATNTVLNTVFTDTATGEFAAMACVVAPEPSSLIGLGLGAGFLLMLRRRR